MEKRTRISDVQRGMIGTGAMYKEMVLKAATDIGLTKTQVEASIIIFHFYLEYSRTNRLQLQGFH